MPTEILVPQLGESVMEATVGRWLKQPGERVSVGEAVVEIETDKVNLEVGAEKDGTLARIDRQQGDDVKVGDVLGMIDETGAGTAQARPGEPKAEPAPAPARPMPVEERATPVARRLAESNAVDLSRVTPTGPGGRVTKTDVQHFIEGRVGTPAAPGASPAPAATTRAAGGSDLERTRREERVRMSRRRRTIARRLVEAQHSAAMLTTFNEVDMTAVQELRQRHKEAFMERHKVGLGLMSFFVKAAVGALKVFPRLNAEIQEDDMLLKHYYDIGMAIGAEEGLVVPVLRDADQMSFAEIERAIKGYAQQVNDGTLALESLQGGSFTITNGGIFGSLLSTPILNPPQVGILGLHKIEQRPIAVNGQVAIRPMMYIALSYDHRIVDGREAVQFLVRVKQLIEDPTLVMLDM